MNGVGFSRFSEAFRTAFGIDRDTVIVASSSLVDDLGFDSLLLSELYMLIGDITQSELPYELADKVTTVGDAYACVRPFLGE
jgi:acyl carrier protein